RDGAPANREAVAPPPASPPAGRRSLRILLAEDHLVNQKLAARLLEKQGHTVTVVSTGKEALDALGRPGAVFDAVLMDVQMPDMGGVEADGLLRQWEGAGRLRLSVIV